MKNQEESHVLWTVDGYSGVITLNRPKALNALSLSMIRDITQALIDWKDDPKVRSIIIKSDSEKAFCSGGDIRSVYEARYSGDSDLMVNIFQEEYLLNYMIGIYPKPYIALIDGIAMGGGLGISIHGSHRIVTERTTLAMPETNIGFFPDIGSGFFLNQCPGEIGTFLAVLGQTITGEDALYAGLATHRFASQELPNVYKALTTAQSREEIDEILQDGAGGQADCFLQTHRNLIDRCFSFQTVEQIFAALQKEADPVAVQLLKDSIKKSPTSLKLALAHMRQAKGQSLKDVLTSDFRISQHCVAAHDFFEGIRAVLVDKDQNPRWNPGTLEAITQKMVEGYFTEL